MKKRFDAEEISVRRLNSGGYTLIPVKDGKEWEPLPVVRDLSHAVSPTLGNALRCAEDWADLSVLGAVKIACEEERKV